MASVHPLGATGIKDDHLELSFKCKQDAKPGGDSIECAGTGKGTHDPPSFPPCLVNLLLDPLHPHHFALTPERLEIVSGAAGSCLDTFKTHVRDTVGTDAYLRALGSMDEASLRTLFEQALGMQGHGQHKAGPLARMAAGAGLVLLQDRIASSVLEKIETRQAVCSMLTGDERLCKLLLVSVSTIADRDAQVKLLMGFGLGPWEAARVAKLVSPWIPQEIESPTDQSKADVHKADKLLKKGLARAHKMLSSLEPEIRTWQLSHEIDLLADFGPETKTALMDLGLQNKASVLAQAIGEHTAQVDKDRDMEAGVKFAISLVAGLAGKAGILADLPGVLAGKKRLDDLTLLMGMGIASAEAVDDARKDLLVTILETVI